jgi:hypothetical protein
MSPSHPTGRLPRSFPICLGAHLHGSVSRTCITGLLLQKLRYRLTVEGNGLGKGVECKLLDRLTGKTTSMEADGTRSYDFTVTDDSLSTGDRFMVLFSKPSTLTVPPDASAGGAGLRLHPNPVRERLWVTSEGGGPGPYAVRVFDASGREVLQMSGVTSVSNRLEIETSGLKAGMYSLLLTDSTGEVKTVKFLRE